jgi:DNA repair exonuclease SbcCD ATPase subunit
MKLIRVELDNYAPFDKTVITFDQNSYIIVGVNNSDNNVASNGAGKSCLIQAIIWAIFGNVIRQGLLVDDIIGSCRSHVRVIIEFEHLGKIWKIDRARKFSGRRNNEPIVIIDGEDVSRHKDNDSFIQEQLGFTFEMFLLAAYSDADTIPFCRLSPANMLKNLTEVLDLDKIDVLLDKSKALLKESKQAAANSVSQYKSLESMLLSLEKSFKSTSEAVSDFETQKAKSEREFVNELFSLNRELETCEEELEEIDKYKLIEKAIDQRVNEAVVYEKHLKTLEKTASELALKKNTTKSSIEKLKKELTDTQYQHDNIAINESCICQYCDSKFNPANLGAKINALASKIDLLKVSIYEAEGSEVRLNEQVTKNQEEINKAKILLKEYAGVHADKNEIAVLLKGLQGVQARKTELSSRVIPRVERQLEEIRSKSIEPYKKALKDQQEKIESVKLDLENIKSEEFFSLKKAELVADLLTRLANWKTIVLQEFVLSLQDQININLVAANTDIKCQIEFEDKKLYLLFTNASKGQDFYAYSFFSRGERSKIDKACALALNDLFGIGVYLDDEGLSGLDWEAAKGLLDFMTESTQTRILVFHNERIQSYLQQRQIGLIKVEKTNGISKASIDQ